MPVKNRQNLLHGMPVNLPYLFDHLTVHGVAVKYLTIRAIVGAVVYRSLLRCEQGEGHEPDNEKNLSLLHASLAPPIAPFFVRRWADADSSPRQLEKVPGG